MIYEYQCTECGEINEVMSSVAEMEEERDLGNYTCPECGALIKKIMSESSFILKGGGWFADGYASTKGKGAKVDG